MVVSAQCEVALDSDHFPLNEHQHMCRYIQTVSERINGYG